MRTGQARMGHLGQSLNNQAYLLDKRGNNKALMAVNSLVTSLDWIARIPHIIHQEP